LEDVRVKEKGHGDTEEKQKTSLFYLCIVDLGTITGFFKRKKKKKKQVYCLLF